ncbi:hypothetical protein V501_06436 [Pseudogymnoascus sp. VKM F-4519 (FW-2642)]|nr:hypothetical protein V501_06436 [Pseudogymnoascus sp. VKM F-4519 (FW-2642)]
MEAQQGQARVEQARLEPAWWEPVRQELVRRELDRLEQACQEERLIMLPTLPNNEPDNHRTLHHYHHASSKYIHGSPHPLYPEGQYQNPRYSIPDTDSPWTGAEDSLLLEQIPYATPPGIRARYGFEILAFWPRISRQMTKESRAKKISNREYTPDNCEARYCVILSQIENPHIGNKAPDGDGGVSQIGKSDSENKGADGDGDGSQIEKLDNGNSGPDDDGGVSQIEKPEHRNRGPDSHRGVNPYGYLIPAAYQLDMPPYIGLDSQLTPTDCHSERMEANLPGKLVNVQKIGTVIGVGQCIGHPVSPSITHDEP